ncbi:MAG: hypothetical protein RLZZ628_1223 [Bacteroidota bacterium]|jgi:hypothetical protein
MFIEDRYEVEISEDISFFEFISEGKQGSIYKIVQYSPTNLKDVYNLGFGDKNLQTGQIDDKIITDNGDSEKVLATVGATVYAFVTQHPKAYIVITGNSAARTRLYRMAINKYYNDIVQDFYVYGLLNGVWRPFKANGNYKAFLIKKI